MVQRATRDDQPCVAQHLDLPDCRVKLRPVPRLASRNQSDLELVGRQNAGQRHEFVANALDHLIGDEHAEIGISHHRVADINDVRVDLPCAFDEGGNNIAVGAVAQIAGDNVAARLDQSAFFHSAQQIADQFGFTRPRMVSKPGWFGSKVVGTAATFNPCACMGRMAALLPTCPCTTWLWIEMTEVVIVITSRSFRSW